MFLVKENWKALAFCLFLSLMVSSQATKISRRHSIHLSVNEPDDPRFSLANLARIFYAQLGYSRDDFQRREVNVKSIAADAALEDAIGTVPPFAAAPGAPTAQPGGAGAEIVDAPQQRTQTLGRASGGASGGAFFDRRNPYRINQRCDRNAEFRRINGTCNNLRRPFRGAAKTPLSRLTRAAYEDRVNEPRETFFRSRGKLPTARAVSVEVHPTTSNLSLEISHLMMTYGQFVDHDLTLSPEAFGEGGVESPKDRCCKVSKSEWINDLRECFALDTSNDKIFTKTCIPFLRSSPVPALPGRRRVRFQLNDLTAFIDGSQVYGSTNIRANSLRTYRDGLLLTSTGLNNEERLPLAKDNPRNCFSGEEECRFAAGDVRNSEQAALTSLHTLLVREHNRIAKALKGLNRRWSDEKLYQTTRKIVGAILQRITYGEFLPLVVGPEIMRKYDLTLLDTGRFTGYSSRVDPSIVTEFSTAAFRFGHSLIRQSFARSPKNQLDIEEVFDAFKSVDKYGSDGFLQGLSDDNMEARERFITKGVRDRLFGEDMDLAAFNIQRGRDHGIASYNTIRRSLNLSRRNSFASMVGTTHDQSSADSLERVYPTPNDIEIFPGGLSELSLPNALVGETFGHIIGEQFRRVKVGDRFWHETNDRRIGFSDAQLAEIRKVSLAGLYCKNIPGVAVRELLFVAETTNNPTVDCTYIPEMDLSAWKE